MSGFILIGLTPYQIIRVIVFAFMVVVFSLPPGSDSAVFQGVSVFWVSIYICSAGSLSNIIAGLILTYMRLFKIGDRVKIEMLYDNRKSLLVTRIRTIKTK
jgi:small-conductance mechanosensitive channel